MLAAWLFIASVNAVFAQADGVPDAAPTTPVNSAVTFTTKTTHALSLFGDVKYGPNFEHFDYVNPDAPKGGRVRLSAIGGFDSLNPFIVNGNPADGLVQIYDQLMTSSFDEPSTDYGLLAESVEVPSDFSWVTYTLRDGARWHDGRPITPEDVIFSLKVLKEKGFSFYRSYYANIVQAEQVGERAVKFTFDQSGNRELPLITGQLYILPKHFWESADRNGQPRDFAKATLEPPLGSGPYRIGKFDANRSITYERVEDYWAADLPVNKGQYNFDTIQYEYYRDIEISLTALFADEYDIRAESSAKNWSTRYRAPPVKDGLIKKELIPSKNPSGMQGFFFNLRRPKFHDPRVREAIGLAFNFEWINKYLFYDQYTRTKSFFDNSELASSGLPTGAELDLLEPFRGELPEEIFTEEFSVPQTDGSGKYRKNLARALELLNEAGWSLIDRKITNEQTKEVLKIEFLIVQPTFERIIQPFLRDLERIGIEGEIRVVDSSQYQNRFEQFDYDVVVFTVGQSLSPGNEQREYWGSEAANRPGSRNVAGIKSDVIDQLIDKVVFARNREELVIATHALDRVLLRGFYVVPQWYLPGTRFAYWDRFGRPDVQPPFQTGVPSIWWYEGEPEAVDSDGKKSQK